MEATPKGLRLHIGIFGRRNVGKSSLLNALTRQEVAIVSDQAGTTTDPVEKPMEMLPLGPVLFIDTAGIDDTGTLGALRVRQTRRVFERVDVALVVTEQGQWGAFERQLLDELRSLKIPVLAVFNKADLARPSAAILHELEAAGIPHITTMASAGGQVPEVRDALWALLPKEAMRVPPLVGDLVAAGGLAVLVVPIDTEAPKGRLILPQVQTIRELLDVGAGCLVTRERELREALGRLRRPPDLVVTDSQAFLKVAADTPPDVRLTSFSILFARHKGDLNALVAGALAIDRLRPGDRVLVSEACTHHPITDDIGRVKIPRWLTQYVGGRLQVDHVQGKDFPDELGGYRLVIHCGACMFNRRLLLSRIWRCQQQGVPVTNYGLAIARSLGILERALQPFPAALELVRPRNPAG